MGRMSWKEEPWPTVERHDTSPPMSLANWRQMESPRPVPPWCRVVDLSPCVNGWNRFSCTALEMPGPVSTTEKTSFLTLIAPAHRFRHRFKQRFSS
jgi:hypothetical protein